MTVKELKDALARYDDDAQVAVMDDSHELNLPELGRYHHEDGTVTIYLRAK